MAIRVENVEQHILNMRTRMPFKYGIASLTAVPHLFVSVTLNVDGKTATGIAADGLPPKWFTKDPETHFREDLDEMRVVIGAATGSAKGYSKRTGGAPTVFEFCMHNLDYVTRSIHLDDNPPLLRSFAASLIERAIIDGFCHASKTTLAKVVRKNTLGIRLGAIHDELDGVEHADLLPDKPLRKIVARHTIGLGDPLTDAEINDDNRIDDGLPQSLEQCIRTYGLTHFKVKVNADVDWSRERLRTIAVLLSRHCGNNYAFTLDGNEAFTSVDAFGAMWEALRRDEQLASLWPRLLFVEQPLHRDVALTDETGAALKAWADRPPMIIDEADGELHSARRAIDLGYVGTSHKNCKGVFKGIANACLIEHRRRTGGPEAQRLVMSGEDLANVGPVALLQDLAVMATLGITHVERNGHHYFRGLSMYDADVQRAVVAQHGDLYRMHDAGFATLDIKDGAIDVGSVVDAPFGYAIDFDPTRYTPVSEWRYDSLERD
ncbi:MAG: hypothetical protein GC159_18430 [Phycisphaera sp.]|nr:hypothetical protein [Phycisphaera sp.]